MNLLPIFAELGTLPAWLVAFLVPLMLLCIGCLIWAIMPRRGPRSHADIEQQIKTLRRHADREVSHRPRVRGNGCATPPAAHLKAQPDWVHNGSIRGNGAVQPAAAKQCRGVNCLHPADCAGNHYCLAAFPPP